MITIGIDPGITGAFAVLDSDGQYVCVHDFPTMNRNKSDNKQQINVAELGRMLREIIGTVPNAFAVIMERVTAMPSVPGSAGGGRRSMGSASAFIFGKTIGHLEGVVQMLGVRVEFVQPGTWKKALGLPKDKQAGRAFAQQLWPAAPLGKKKDHNRAEALLLAKWYSERAQALVSAPKLLRRRG